MAEKSKRTKQAGEAAKSLRSNQYVRRLIEDEQLRDDIGDAFDAIRHAYGRASNGKGSATKKLIEDRKVQKDLREAASSLRDASARLRGSSGKHHFGRLFLIAFAGAGLALAFSEGARKAILDRLFGAEEEFEYSSTTSASENGTEPADVAAEAETADAE